MPSLLGDGMPERLRSTSIALLGAVAAVCLGTVAFALQLGLPSVTSGPLPKAPGPPAVADRTVVAEQPSGEPDAKRVRHDDAPAPDAGIPAPTPAPLRGGAEPDRAVANAPSDGAVLVTEPSHAQRPQPTRAEPDDDPVAVATPDPAPVEPSATSSEVPPPPVPEPAPEPPVSVHPGNGNAYGKGNGNGVGNGGVPPGQAAKGASAEASG